MSSLFSLVLALFLTTVFVPIGIRYADRLKLVDSPYGYRRIHQTMIPRIGGVAIFAGVTISLLVWLPSTSEFAFYFYASTVILVFGLLDDIFDLTNYVKFAGQFIAAAIFITGFGGFTQLPFMGLEGSWDTSGANNYVWAVWTVSAVPLPAAVWLFGSALCALVLVGRRRNQYATTA